MKIEIWFLHNDLNWISMSMVETCSKPADEGVLERPIHHNFCLGQGNTRALSATPQNPGYIRSLMEPGSHWKMNHDQMNDFSIFEIQSLVN